MTSRSVTAERMRLVPFDEWPRLHSNPPAAQKQGKYNAAKSTFNQHTNCHSISLATLRLQNVKPSKKTTSETTHAPNKPLIKS